VRDECPKTMTVVRCPYCVSDDEFRQMIARLGGRFACDKSGYSAIPDDNDFKCSCRTSYGTRPPSMRLVRHDPGFCENSPDNHNALKVATMKIIGRNAPCSCGSGKKYKGCHGAQMLKASMWGWEAGVPWVYQPFAANGISPRAAEAMKRASRQ
jgi:hypothetical protein